MLLQVKFHDVGEGITEGEVVDYLVEEGERVSIDQPLVEVQTDKMVAQLPSPTTGTIKEIIVEVGETVHVGTTLLHIEQENKQKREGVVEDPPETRSPQRNVPYRSVNTIQRVLATPYTRKIARDHNVNIEKIMPTGPDGRVTEEDVYQHVKNKQLTTDEPYEQEVGSPSLNVAVHDEEELEYIPFRGIRKQIAKNMVKSLFTIPHVTHFDDIDVTNVMNIRQQLKRDGTAITVVAFFIKALVVALKDFPIFNAELDEQNERIILKKDYHIGMATDTESGLLVPVIHNVDQKSIIELHRNMKRLIKKANEGTLTYGETRYSTCTVSNVGPLGSTGATPIIHYPETALIAFHQAKKTPVVNEKDEIVIRQMMPLSMSFDHRVADGATAIQFTNRLKRLIEHPGQLLVELI